MSQTSPLPQSRSRSSLLSNTTYYSFHDMEPQSAPPTSTTSTSTSHTQPDRIKQMHDADNISISEMHRQDSGYESLSPRDPPPGRRSRSSRRESASASASATSSRPTSRAQPSTRRSSKSRSVTRAPKPKRGNRSLLLTQSNPVSARPSSHYSYPDSASTSPYSPQANAQSSYFHFPPPDPLIQDGMLPTADEHEHGHENGHGHGPMHDFDHPPSGSDDAPLPGPAPPQTTHYWTSDHTRRLEYAAIDAASRGFKGWLMRHMVPDCFVPKAKRRVTFDDDTGSVRRYRLELDESEESADKGSQAGGLVRRPEKKRAGTFWM